MPSIYLISKQGFTFLNIPRSYYGILTREMLENGLQHAEAALSPPTRLLSPACAEAIYCICSSEGLLHDDCSLALDVTKDSIMQILSSKMPANFLEEYAQNKVSIVKTILHSRYVNLHNLLRVSDEKATWTLPCLMLVVHTHSLQHVYWLLIKDHLSEDSYVAIVRNQILVDVQVSGLVAVAPTHMCIPLAIDRPLTSHSQGEDLLFQIFTSNILQRKCGDESPFFEFIQRVCSNCIGADGCPKKPKPGCGGFG